MAEDTGTVSFDDGAGEVVVFEEKFSKMAGMLDEQVLEKVSEMFGDLNQWKCSVYYKKDGIAQTALVGNYTNDLPDPDEIGKRVGGGRVRYILNAKNPKTGKKVFGEFTVHLDSSYDLQAKKYRVESERELMLSQPAKNQTDEATKALVGFATKSMEISATRPDSSMEMFRFMMESQAKSEERVARLLEKLSERKEPTLLDKINEIKALKEMGLFGGESGGDSKGTVAQILEVLAPVAQTIIETMGGRGTRPTESEPDDVATALPPPPSLDQLAQEIVAKIDKWLGIFFPISTGSVLKDKVELAKANVARNTARNNPEIRKLLQSEQHVSYIRQNIGEEKFAKLVEVFK